MYILGISAFYHDSAACLIKDGEILAAAQEERFTRKKHDFSFPTNSINYCLSEANIQPRDLDYVGFYDKPFLKFERILETTLTFAPSGIRQFLQAMPLWIREKLWTKDSIYKNLLGFNAEIIFSQHHEAHAASAFYPSPFKEAAFLTMDGVGEWDTASFGTGKDNDFKIERSLRFPHSLGLLYSAFTYYTGFRVNSGEYKLMGLAPYGQAKYVNLILKELIDLKQDGSFRLNMRYFGFCNGLRMINRKFEKLFGGPARKPETLIRERDMDLARSIQAVTEEIMLRMARHVHKVTGKRKLCLAGGVALNCVGNGRILREGPFEDIWIQPASGDAGGALGVALLIWYKFLNKPRNTSGKDSQKASLLGTHFDDDHIENFLRKKDVSYIKLSPDELVDKVAQLIADEKVIGWFQNRMEFGPRALGSRSILGDARSRKMQSKMNLKIKFRESFRPFAPTVLKEKAGEYFEIDRESPYMLLTAPVKNDHRYSLKENEKKLKGIDKLRVIRSDIPAVTHVDYSARIQTVKHEDNPIYYDLINAFYKKTGCPVVINTSFNVRGEPIVCSPQDAFNCFLRTDMDYLVMGSFLLAKSEQKTSSRKIKPLKYAELD
ncbi:MAG: carbamoyltransferase [Candidatus Omnitrophica bacterium]|nr:carbamoyltransferase [Candidatus Omnitrophota bacterium]